MAIRLNGSAAIYRTANLLNLDANYAVSFWLYVIARPGAENYSVLWQQNPGAGNSIDSYNILKIDASTAYFNIYTLSSAGTFAESTASTNISLNTWYHIGIIRSANNSRIMYVNGTAHVTHTANLSGRTASTEMDMGVTIVNPGDYLDGRIAHIKIWQATMTAAQIAAEANVIRPIEVSGLNQWYPTFAGATERLADYSGNGRNWTASGTLSDEDNPPVAWGAPVWVVPFAASAGAIEGTLAATLGDITSSSTGTVAIAATAAPTLAAATLSSAATLALSGTLTKTLGDATVSSAGTVGGAPITGTLTATLDNATVSGAAAVALTGALTKTLGDVTAASTGYHLEAACIGGVLTANATNGRYFENDAGPLVLAGSHTWYNTQDGDSSYPPDPFEWDDYLTRLSGHGHNFTLLWRLEAARDWPSDNTQRFGVQPYARTGPGNAADGQLKFDLDTWDNDYFERLLQRAITAGNAGLYVGVMLFQGFHIDNTKNGTPTGDPWDYHPFNAANNINSVNGDPGADGIAEELRDTAQTALYNRSKAFVEKVIDTLNHLDNVIWEIENEGGTYSVDWQHDLIDHIHTYEAGKAKQHPVGMVKCYPGGSNTDLTTSNADWISPDDDLAPDAVTSTAQVRAYDTDHSVGDTDTFDWVFRALTRGYGGIWYMDPWYGTSTGDTRDNATYELIRAVLGYALDYAARLDLENATPQGSLSSTGYCIAKTTGAAQLLAYQDGTGAFDVTLTSISGTFSVEWLRISTGTVQSGGTVSGGAVRTLTPPWSGEVVAFLELSGIDGALAATLAGVTSTATGTVAISGAAAITLAAVTSTAAGALALTGTATPTLADVTSAAAGAVALVGQTAVTLDAVSITATSALAIIGAAAAIVDDVTLTATGASGAITTGQLAVTLADVTSTAASVVAIVGQVAATLADFTIASAGTVALTGQATPTLDAVTATAAGTLAIVGQAAVTLDDVTLVSGTGALTTGQLAVTLGDVTIVSAGTVAFIVAVIAGSVRGPATAGGVTGAQTTGKVS